MGRAVREQRAGFTAGGRQPALRDLIVNSELVCTESEALSLSLHSSNPPFFYSSSKHFGLTDLCRSHRHGHVVQKASNTIMRRNLSRWIYGLELDCSVLMLFLHKTDCDVDV